MAELLYTHVESPVGQLLIAGDGEALHFISFPNGREASQPRPGWRPAAAPFVEARRQLAAYFGQELREFDLPIHLSGSPFQNRAWRYLATIPYGETRSYGQMAADLGDLKASRAVGTANGSNPLPIILPCHRVIGADGTLTGFGGGLPTKRFLLRLEGVITQEDRQPDLFQHS